MIAPAAAAGPGDLRSGIVRLLEHIGEDPDREGLRDTPERVIRALSEMTAGYGQDPREILSTTFGGADAGGDVVRYRELVILRDIRFTSLCEHHLLPFSGLAHVGYLPGGAVVGLSKIARLVECFARRLQMQERLTQQVVEALMEHLAARGAGAVIVARHACMGCRGIRKAEAKMVTSALLGELANRANRAEFLSLVSRFGVE